MQYHVVYLIAGERRTAHIEAADAAGALARLSDRSQARFELLAVLRTDALPPVHRAAIGRDRTVRARRDCCRA